MKYLLLSQRMRVTSTKHIPNRRQDWGLNLGTLAWILMSNIYCISKLVLHLNTKKWLNIYLDYYFHNSAKYFFYKIFYEIFPLTPGKVYATKFCVLEPWYLFYNLLRSNDLADSWDLHVCIQKPFDSCVSPKHIGPKCLLTDFTHELVFSNNLMLKAHF